MQEEHEDEFRITEDQITSALQQVLELLPKTFEMIEAELSVLTGRKINSQKSSNAFGDVTQKLENLFGIFLKLSQYYQQPLTPQTARNKIQSYNIIIRVLLPHIPRNRKPIEWIIEQVKQDCEVAPELESGLPNGLDYLSKHWQLHDFIADVINHVDQENITALLRDSISDRGATPSYQRAFNEASLPKALSRPPTKTSVSTAERVKLALHEVLVDWGSLLELVYGFYRLRKGDNIDWGLIRRVSLWDKVTAISNDPLLNVLGKTEWVTARNALDHGNAYLDPATQTIVYHDIKRELSWTLEESVFQGQDIYLTNIALLRISNFITAARCLHIYESHIRHIEEMAQLS